jgi:hypothetical protein
MILSTALGSPKDYYDMMNRCLTGNSLFELQERNLSVSDVISAIQAALNFGSDDTLCAVDDIRSIIEKFKKLEKNEHKLKAAKTIFSAAKPAIWRLVEAKEKLCEALATDDLDLAEQAIALYPAIVQGQGQDSPLLEACKRGRCEIALLLLKHGSNPNVELNGNSPVSLAIDYGAVMKPFLDAVPKEVSVFSQAKLWKAVRTNDLRLAEQAIEIYPPVVNLTLNGCSPLMYACKHSYCDLAILLLHKGANTRHFRGKYSPLLIALKNRPKMGPFLMQTTQEDQAWLREFNGRVMLSHKFSVPGSFTMESFDSSVSLKRSGYFKEFTVSDFIFRSTGFYRELQSDLLNKQGSIWDRLSDNAKKALDQLSEDDLKKASQSMGSVVSLISDGFQHRGNRIEIKTGELSKEGVRCLDSGEMVVFLMSTRRKLPEGSSKKSSGHFWGVVVSKDPESSQYFIEICNRGLFAYGFPGINVLKVDKREMLKIVKSCSRQAGKSDGSLLLKAFSFKMTDAKEYFREKAQTVGNCSYYNLQSIMLAVIRRLLRKIKGLDPEAAAAIAKEIKHLCTADARLAHLNEYFLTHLRGECPIAPDWEMLKAIYAHSLTKPKLAAIQVAIETFTSKMKAKESAGTEDHAEAIKFLLFYKGELIKWRVLQRRLRLQQSMREEPIALSA